METTFYYLYFMAINAIFVICTVERSGRYIAEAGTDENQAQAAAEKLAAGYVKYFGYKLKKKITPTRTDPGKYIISVWDLEGPNNARAQVELYRITNSWPG